MPFVRLGGLAPARPIMTPLFNENVYIGVHSSTIGGQEQASQEFLTFLMQQTLTSTTPSKPKIIIISRPSLDHFHVHPT